MQRHKDVTGLRNKSFPHFDELAFIFGKDRATREGAEAPTDAVETIDVEETVGKEASEAYFSMNVGNNDDGMVNRVSLENFQESVFFNNTGNNKSSPSTGKRPTMQGETDVARKRQKIKKSNEIDEIVLKNMAKLGEVCEGAKEEIGKLATCFQHLADNAKWKMQIYDAIAAIEGLTDEDALKADAIISTDVDKTNFLFSIPDHMKKLYVQQLLNGSI
ncbi:hypothetical protein PTKIN_Ptkin01aG0248800 [Pterospermum kingtungense]